MNAAELKEQGYLVPYVPKCPDCLVLMVEHDGGWFCPYALAAKAAVERSGGERSGGRIDRWRKGTDDRP